MVTLALNINTDPIGSETTNPDKVLDSSSDRNVTMAPGERTGQADLYGPGGSMSLMVS